MLKSYLLENYGYNEPIFLNDLKIEWLSENAVRQSVKRLVAKGFWRDMLMESIIYRKPEDFWKKVIWILFWSLCVNM